MEPNIYCQRLPERVMQTCPLCGERQPIIIHGLSADLETGHMKMCADMGYSFCNCRNVFFTDWSNIKQDVYDEGYHLKYKTRDIEVIAKGEFKKFLKVIKQLGYDPQSIFEIGAITDDVLDSAKEAGLETFGNDIFEHPSQHQLIFGNFENEDFLPRTDLIWASHVFEHFRDPGAQLNRCKSALSPNGILYIAMPDTFAIDFDNPSNTMNWDWNVREHHILWGMESFIEYAAEHGLKCVYSERNIDLWPQKDKTWFWKKDFKVLLTHA